MKGGTMKAMALGDRLKESYEMVCQASIKIQPINFELGERLHNISNEIRDIEVKVIGDKDEKSKR